MRTLLGILAMLVFVSASNAALPKVKAPETTPQAVPVAPVTPTVAVQPFGVGRPVVFVQTPNGIRAQVQSQQAQQNYQGGCSSGNCGGGRRLLRRRYNTFDGPRRS